MANTTKRKGKPTRSIGAREQGFINRERELKRLVQRERNIQRRARRLEREVTNADHTLGELADSIASRSGLELVAKSTGEPAAAAERF